MQDALTVLGRHAFGALGVVAEPHQVQLAAQALGVETHGLGALAIEKQIGMDLHAGLLTPG
ncbi:hypothetical protein D3C78_1707080 [compost metagenome]